MEPTRQAIMRGRPAEASRRVNDGVDAQAAQTPMTTKDRTMSPASTALYSRRDMTPARREMPGPPETGAP